MMKKKIHIIANAHLDSVWFWDWREGLSEGIRTCRTMVKLLEEIPEFKFIRGESSVYENVEKYEPELFAKIKELVAEGRWEIVGGNYVQPDTNLPDTATMIKQYEVGKAYFKEKFNFDVQVAWAPDSFGHSAGFPEIYTNAGMKYFAFSRQMSSPPPVELPVFYWCAPSGEKVLTLMNKLAWYGCDRDEVKRRLDLTLENSKSINMRNIATFVGLGDHGGGPSRQMILDALEWKKEHEDEVEVEFSTLQGFFTACEAENIDFQEYSGEINFALRGCASSVAKIKTKFRQCETAVRRAERVDSLISKYLKQPPHEFNSEWKGLLFNTFHDILPGTSIDRANAEQIEWMDSVIHTSRAKEYDAMAKLSKVVAMPILGHDKDMPEAVPFLIFNPLPYQYDGLVELETNIDYRPNLLTTDIPLELRNEELELLPFQNVATEHNSLTKFAWRKRVVTHLTIPPCSWRVLSLGYVKQTDNVVVKTSTIKTTKNSISNDFFEIHAQIGSDKLVVKNFKNSEILKRGIRFAIFEDQYGSWGGMDEVENAWLCENMVENWKISNVKILEQGPLRACMFVVFAGEKSQIRLRIILHADKDMMEFSTQVIWQNRATRLCMLFDTPQEIDYRVSGGRVIRSNFGDVPSGRWINFGEFGFASNGLCGFAKLHDSFAVNMIRGCRSSSDDPYSDEEYQERPISDYGDHKFNFVFTGKSMSPFEASNILDFAPINIISYPKDGIKDAAVLASIDNKKIEWLDLNHIQSLSENKEKVTVFQNGKSRQFELLPFEIVNINENA